MVFKRYIGDGVYVNFDGYNITIAVNDDSNVVAYLEPEVMANLIKYQNDLTNHFEEKQKENV